MVYCGKPSKSCRQCRSRNIKCDHKRPSCGQCTRAYLPCSGYTDPSALRIRDQTWSTSRKVLSQSKLRSSTKDKIFDSEQAPQRNPTTSVSSSLHNIAISVEEQAQILFYEHFVHGNSCTFDYLPSFYSSTPYSSPAHLTVSIQAVSLAHFARTVDWSQIFVYARQKYAAALKLTNEVLTHPDLAMQDSTLVAVLLLDLYEKLDNFEDDSGSLKTLRSHKSWTEHINGAVALVNLRGEVQFHNPLGLRMFLQLASNILIKCVTYGIAVPSYFIALRDYASSFVDTKDPKWRFSSLMIRFVELRVAMNKEFETGRVRRMAVEGSTFSEAVKLEQDFQLLADATPRIWPHDVRNWNILRLSRVLLNETILDLCSENYQDDPFLESHRKHSTSVICQLVDDICDSVPLFMTPPTIDTSFSLRKRMFSQAEMTQGYHLLFPLYVSARSRVVSQARRTWIIERIRFVEENMGTRNAGILMKKLEGSRGCDGLRKDAEEEGCWKVYASLGSYSFAAG